MRFTETYLRNAYERMEKIGEFRGKDVYAITKRGIGYGEYWKGNAYVIFDDGNKLFFEGKIIGDVKYNGDVNIYNTPYVYEIDLKTGDHLEISNEKMNSKDDFDILDWVLRQQNQIKTFDWEKEEA